MQLTTALMGVAAGIGIHATLTNSLVGFSRRPRDQARIAFAVAALAAAIGALAVLSMYSADDLGTYVAIAKWAFFPASVVWTTATVWFVAKYTGVGSRLFLYGLTAGFGLLVLVDFALPAGLLHDGSGRLVTHQVFGGSIMVPSGTSPHPLHYATYALTVIAFLFLCYAVYRVHRDRPGRKARYLGLMTLLLAVASLLDTINEHAVAATFTRLYLTQICFAFVIVAVSMGLRSDSLRTENELTIDRSRLDALVERRMQELDAANERLAQEAAERRATEEVLRHRVEELDALQSVAQVLGTRSSLTEAMEEAAGPIARLFKACYARVKLSPDPDAEEERAERAVWDGVLAASCEAGPPLSALDLAACERCERDGATVTEAVATWPGLSDEARARAADEGIAYMLAQPMTTSAGAAGTLLLAREDQAGPFTGEDRRLARIVAEALAAVVEIDRLHRRETRQAATRERQALARDLHDAVTQSIYGASLIAEALPAVYERDPGEGQRHLEHLRRLVRAALAEMRTLLFELRPAALETAPLDGLIQRLADALEGQADLGVHVEVEDHLELPYDVKVALYRVTQEAFSNIAKHARASQVSARVAISHGVVVLTVTDDGRGFDPAAVIGGHLGLRIMSERLERVGGTFRVSSAPGQGTTLQATYQLSSS